ncbi:hypothetical protein B5X24_HaOG206184 [Helicoverpa armigera]|nr:hypothetical protein B5X24_HaOG206184 [Helicoverpa armigera]
MAKLHHVVLGILILQIYVHAAPNDVSKLEDIAKVEHADSEVEQTETKLEAEPKLDDNPKLDADPKLDFEPKLDSQPKEIEIDENLTETQRQKRWYNPYGYGFPPINPLIYPSLNIRDENPNSSFYGGEDPLEQIHKRIQEIAHAVRQPPIPPPTHFPIFYPVLFIPSGDCNCNPSTPQPNTPVRPQTNGTAPSVNNRWPVMEDERQNWGFVINETDSDEDEDFSRPISFDPIKLDRPMRPPPPVDHGTVQSDSTNNQNQPNQADASPGNSPMMPQTTRRPPIPPSVQGRPPSGLAPPSPCDGAILTCCHQAQVAYDCFAVQGCPDLTGYGNPCDPSLILRVIERFQTYYGQRKG